MPDTFDPREGGVKIVFDVPEKDVDKVAVRVAALGFDVHRYYPDDERRPGGSQPGYVRLGAERAMTEFTDSEISVIVADFDAMQVRTGLPCVRIGTDTWTADSDGPSGDREPRSPSPRVGAGSATAVRGVAVARY